LEAGGPLDHALRSLKEAIAELPENVDLLAVTASPELSFVAGVRSPIEAPLRSFLEHAFMPEAEAAFVDLREAIEDALAEGTQDARLFLHAGVINAAAGRNRDARRWLKRAEHLRPMLLPSESAELARHLTRTR
jgi:hypothetical protein